MLAAQSMVDNVANNLANVSTSGFKQTLMQIQTAPTMDLYRMQNDPGQAPGKATPGIPTMQFVGPLGLGAQIYDTPNSFEQGPLQSTGNPLDLALSGANGFFAIQTPQGTRYTRDGHFVVAPNGQLVTPDGNPVLSQRGQAITLQTNLGNQNSPVSISPNGAITQNGQNVDQLAIVSFNNLNALRAEGSNQFVDSGQAGPQAATGISVQQGMLEQSNANVVRSMVDLITAERWFDANSKAAQSEDTATNMAITQVAKTQ